MEGPTPVSALIHAATMVNAGVYLVARTNPIFAHAPEVMVVVAAIGIFTAILAASIAFTQTDIKRVLAYSTLSQLGYMFAALGVGAWTAAIFHLMAHGFFKGLLFLDSGSVIHAVHDEQDMRRMGGLSKKIPITYGTMLIGSIAISGIPPLAGFFSKDEILGDAFKNGFLWVWAIGLPGRRHDRLLHVPADGPDVLGQEPGRSGGRAADPRIAAAAMTVPLILLAIPTVLLGLFLGLPFGASRIADAGSSRSSPRPIALAGEAEPAVRPVRDRRRPDPGQRRRGRARHRPRLALLRGRLRTAPGQAAPGRRSARSLGPTARPASCTGPRSTSGGSTT